MSLVARILISVPERSATETWNRVVEIIAPDEGSPSRRELAAVSGVACSCISDEALADDPLVVYGAGPRLHLYALHGDDAVEGERANESALSWVPTDGDWHMSIPCRADDLAWVRSKLASASTRVTAREVGTSVEGDERDTRRAAAEPARTPQSVNLNAFFRR